MVFVPSVWVFLIAAILKPLGLHQVNDVYNIALLFSFITAVSAAFVVYISPLIFRCYYKSETWTKGKYFVSTASIMILIVPFATIATHYFLTRENIPITISPIHQLFIWLIRVFFIGIFPTFFLYILYRKLAPETTYSHIEHHNEDITSEKKEDIIVLSGNTKESVEFLPHSFLYAEVLGNYVTIYYLEENRVQQKSLRTTLSQITEILNAYPQFVRCHRAFIVNISNVVSVRGNSHAYKLTVNNMDAEIPVSKSYTRIIKEKLNM